MRFEGSLRDAAIACALIAAAVFAVYATRRRPGGPSRPKLPPAVRGPEIARTPVLKRSFAALPAEVRRRLAQRERERAQAEALKEEEEARRAREEAERALRAADEERRRLAGEEMSHLSSYRELLPTDDAEYYGFLLRRFSDASEYGLNRPKNLEGLFLNIAFFAAGGWGKNPGFRRAWVYLFRALGIELAPEVERALVKTVQEIYEIGREETRAIETAVFGAPLEGGDPGYWEVVGYPPLADCEVAWEVRNDYYMELYGEFLSRLKSLLPEEDYARFCEFLELFNLSS